MVAVDDRRQGAHDPSRVVNHWIDRRVSNDMEISPKVFVFLYFFSLAIIQEPRQRRKPHYLIEGHQLLSIHFLRLIQRYKADILRRKGLIGEWTLNSVQIMSANGHQRPLPGKILVELVLQCDERLVSSFVKGDIPEYSSRNVWPNSRRLYPNISPLLIPAVYILFPTHIFLHNYRLELPLRRYQSVIWQRFPTQENIEHQRDALETKKVISTPSSAILRGSLKGNTNRFAGISIFSWGGSCFPSTMGRSEFVVCISFSIISHQVSAATVLRLRRVQCLVNMVSQAPQKVGND
jgi:hypothetical protein